MAYRLFYWAKRGRGEQVRLLLNELDAPYEDVHLKGESFRALQAEGPRSLYFGSVPMLEDGDFRLCQAPTILAYLARKHDMLPKELPVAAKAAAIAWGAEDLRQEYFGLFGEGAEDRQRDFVEGRWTNRWLPNLSGLLELGGGEFFVGGRITQADIAVWDVLDSMQAWVSGATLDGFPGLAKFYAAIKERPRIAAYLESDRRPTS